MIPTKPECYALQAEYFMRMPSKTHSDKVNKVAHYIAQALNSNNHSIDLKLMESSALLHDITKVHQSLTEAIRYGNDAWFEAQPELSKRRCCLIHQQWQDLKEEYGIDEYDRHPKSGGILLKNLGFTEVGAVVEQHNQPLVEISEAGILCYSDRIVGLDIVDLDTRFSYIAERYGQHIADELLQPTKELEKLILETSSLTFEDIQRDCSHG